MKVAMEVASAMHYLHSANPPFIHKDLKSPNILLLNTDPFAPICAKVSDFGTTTRMYVQYLQEDALDRSVANPTWLAPEVFHLSLQFNPPCSRISSLTPIQFISYSNSILLVSPFHSKATLFYFSTHLVDPQR